MRALQRACCALLFLLLGGAAAAQPLAAHRAVVPVAGGATHSTFAFEIQPEPEGSSLAIQFSLLPALKRVVITDPRGTRHELRPGGAGLNTVPAAQRHRPAEGDLWIVTGEWRDPAPGRWQVALEHAAHGRAHGLRWQAVHNPRFQLLARWVTEVPHAGVEATLLVQALDHGRSVEPLALDAEWQPPRGRVPLVAVPARDEAAPITDDPHAWLLRVPAPAAGRHVVTLRAQLSDGRGGQVLRRVQATLDLPPAPPGQDAPLRMRAVPGPGGCWREWVFELDWTAAETGLQVLSVRLPGRGPVEVHVNGSQTVAKGRTVTLSSVLRADQAARLAPGPATAARVNVLAGDAMRLVRSASGVALPQPVDPAAACR